MSDRPEDRDAVTVAEDVPSVLAEPPSVLGAVPSPRRAPRSGAPATRRISPTRPHRSSAASDTADGARHRHPSAHAVAVGRRLTLAGRIVAATRSLTLIGLAAAEFDRPAFDDFAIGLGTCWALSAITLILITGPIRARGSSVAKRRWPRLIGSALRITLVTSIALSLGCALAALLVPDHVRAVLLAVAAVLVGLRTTETVRAASLARLRPGIALLLDGVWTAVWLLGYLLLHPGSPAAQLLLWGLTSISALLVYALLHRFELRLLVRGLRGNEFLTFSGGAAWRLPLHHRQS